jgi:hypothetical protein
MLLFRYLRHIRLAKMGALTFFSGSVWAEMRKSVSYKADVSLDQNMVIQEAQCECGAGQGPTAHCKHVACLLYAVHSFGTEGTIVTEQTCTQVTLIKKKLSSSSFRFSLTGSMAYS